MNFATDQTDWKEPHAHFRRKMKIVDFGLALMFERDADESEEIWATPYYVAPEKLLNQPEDFRSDVYSLGATLYEILTGQSPLKGLKVT